ncbi:protein-tyrosine phosphatase, partial [Ramicandelaber brevisporus]
VVPPLNFAMVAPGIYRSGFPNQRSHQFMLGLGIRTIIYLANDPKQSALDQHTQFALQNGITFKHYRLHHNNLPLEEMDIATVTEVLAILTNPTASTTGTQQYQHQHQHPVLVHCNKGVRRVGCVVGCLRRLQMWSMAAILDEFQRFSGDKIRINDQEFIESFDL